MAGTVTVGSKLPYGYRMSVYRMEDWHEPVMGGGTRTIKRAVKPRHIEIKGTGRRVDDPRMIGGYAITEGVDADFWAAWLADHADDSLVTSGIIFAHAKAADVEAAARAGRSVVTGLEPINPDSLPPEFKRKIEPAAVA